MAKNREERQNRELEVMEYLQQRSREVKLSDVVRKNRTVATTVGREQLFLEQLEASLKEVFRKRLPLPKLTIKKSKGKTSRILNVLISDTHYGAHLDPREVKHKYGPVEEARRTAAVCRQVAMYKRDYRKDTELYIHLLGDIIQGQLHDMRDGDPLAEQVAAAMRILVQAVRFLAREFPKGVTVFTTPGNHGRNTARHRERAVNQKWDSIETMIYTALKEACRDLPNVKVVVAYRDRYEFNLFGNMGFGTHGDTVLNPGYPGRSIDVAGMKRQVNEFNNAQVMSGEKPYSLFIVGHVHVGSMTHLPGGAILITNGCLIPPDHYASSIGIADCACGQWMWESVPGHVVGDARFITVGEANDADASLDHIIQPYSGLGQ